MVPENTMYSVHCKWRSKRGGGGGANQKTKSKTKCCSAVPGHSLPLRGKWEVNVRAWESLSERAPTGRLGVP